MTGGLVVCAGGMARYRAYAAVVLLILALSGVLIFVPHGASAQQPKAPTAPAAPLTPPQVAPSQPAPAAPTNSAIRATYGAWQLRARITIFDQSICLYQDWLVVPSGACMRGFGELVVWPLDLPWANVTPHRLARRQAGRIRETRR